MSKYLYVRWNGLVFGIRYYLEKGKEEIIEELRRAGLEFSVLDTDLDYIADIKVETFSGLKWVFKL